MKSPNLVVPGVLFVGEDDKSRLAVHLGPAAGWMIPKGVGGWSSEVLLVSREALTEDIRRETKTVMPEEQIPPAKNPLTLQAAQKSPLVAVTSKLAPKLVEKGVRVHTIGVDSLTSSFYYIAEGGSEEPARAEGDLVASVGAMLGERADNDAIDRALDGLMDRLLRTLSGGRLSELSVELAAALPRAATDATGLQGVDLDAFEKELGELVGGSEKYGTHAREIAAKVAAASEERRVDVALFGEARKTAQGAFEIAFGDKTVTLPTYERWVAAGPFQEPPAKTASVAPPVARAPSAPPVARAPSAPPAPAAPKAPSVPAAPAAAKAPSVPAAPAAAKVPSSPPAVAATASSPPKAGPSNPPPGIKPLAAPLTPPRPASVPPKVEELPHAPSVDAPKAAATETTVTEVVEAKPTEAKADAKPAETKEDTKEETKAKTEPRKKDAAARSDRSEKADRAEKTPEKRKGDRQSAKAAGTKRRDEAVARRAEEDAVPMKKGGIPWIAIVIALIVAGLVWQLFLKK